MKYFILSINLFLFFSSTISFSQNKNIEQLEMNSFRSSNVGNGQIFTVQNKSILESVSIYYAEATRYTGYFKVIKAPNAEIIYESTISINPNPNETRIEVKGSLILEPETQYAFIICSNNDCSIGKSYNFKAGCKYPNGEIYENGYSISNIKSEIFNSNASFNHCDLAFKINITEVLITPEDTPIIFPNPITKLTDSHSLISINNQNPVGEIMVSNGVLKLNQDDTFIYTPTLDFNGRVSIPYVISNSDNSTIISSIDILVTSIEDTPKASPDYYIGIEDTSLKLNTPLINDYDGDGDLISITLINGKPFKEGEIILDNGKLTVNKDGTILFVPNLNFYGLITFPYMITDSKGNIDSSTINITIEPVNDIPVLNNLSISVDEGNVINHTNSLTNAIIDIENDPLTIELVSNPIHGMLELKSDGTFIYKHDGSETTSDKFTYKINDGISDSNIATVNIKINPINDNPPTNIEISNNSIEENLPRTFIGNIIIEDIDLPFDDHTFEFINGDGDDDNSSFTIEGNKLFSNLAFNYEEKNSLSIRIKATDENSYSLEKKLNINVININDISIIYRQVDSYCVSNSGTGKITIEKTLETYGKVIYEWTATNGGIIREDQKNNQNLTDLPSGTYTLTLTDDQFIYIKKFNIAPIPQYEQLDICYVTSDNSEVTKNRIYINNQGNYNVASYEILRESNVSDVYITIGTISPTENSYLDNASNNLSQSYYYKVRSIDNCGNMSNNSNSHKTILLQSSVAVNNSVNLSWSHYEGKDFSTYTVYRNKNKTGFEEIGSVSSKNNSFNDLTADVTENNYEYFVAINIDECLTNISGKNLTNSTVIRSNLQAIGSLLSINDFDNSKQLSIYPNPAENILNINLDNRLRIIKSEIYDSIGKKIMETKELLFPIDNFSSGMYFIKIFTSEGITTRNFIKK